MSGIEVGEFVRTDEGIIFIYDSDFANDLEMQDASFYNNGEILNHSKNIIDLIEVGDILEAEVDEMYFKAELDKQDVSTKLNNLGNKIKIISILTKEQYNQNCYRLED